MSVEEVEGSSKCKRSVGLKPGLKEFEVGAEKGA